MAHLTLIAAALISIFVESALYGSFAILYTTSTVILIQKKNKQQGGSSIAMLFISSIMFILATLHISLCFLRLFNAFVGSDDPETFLKSTISSPSFILKNATFVLQTLVGDAFMIYRVHIIWAGRWIVVPPVVGCLISTGIGAALLQSHAQVTAAKLIYETSLRHWFIAFSILTLLTELACTMLIAGRIWYIHRKTSALVQGPSLTPTIVLIVESGAMYSICVTLMLILFMSDDYAHKRCLDATVQIIGVVFSMIIVRVGLGVSTEHSRHEPRLDTLFLPPVPFAALEHQLHENEAHSSSTMPLASSRSLRLDLQGVSGQHFGKEDRVATTHEDPPSSGTR
jgi:uncharacterized membrane protein YozB (DUF420 family)